jgi:ribosomal RNA-processing protein 7
MTNSRPPKRRKTSSASSLPESIYGYTLLPIKVPSPLPSVPSAIHVLYVRRHEDAIRPPAVAPPESSRMMFVVNVPIDVTKEILRGLFASLGGRLEDVRFHGQEDDDIEEPEKLIFPDVWDRRLIPSGGNAHITFPNSEDVSKILKTISKERRNQTGAIREWGVGVENPTSSVGLQRMLLSRES